MRRFTFLSIELGTVAVAVASLGSGLFIPALLIPGSALAFSCSVYVAWKSSKLPKRNQLVASKHRQNWRQTAYKELEERAGAIQSQLAEKENSLAVVEGKLKAKIKELESWELGLVATEQKMLSYGGEIEAFWQEQLKATNESWLSEINLREMTILSLQQKIMRLANRPDPKQGFAAWVAQLLLDALEQHQVFCKLVAFQKTPGVREVSIWLELNPGESARKLESLGKEVGAWVKMGEPRILWDEDECVHEFRFEASSDTEEQLFASIDNIKELPAVIEPDDSDWFRRVIRNSFSVLVHGPMGSGKSVTVSNLICVAEVELHKVYGTQPDLVIIDPKFPDSEWIVKNKRIKPNYRGWSDAIAGVISLGEEIDSRLIAAKVAAEEISEELFSDPSYTLPLPDRTPTIWVIDEAAALHERYGNEFALPLKNAFWVGRSTKNIAIAIGQNPNCSNYGLQRPDADNATRLFLGASMALKGLDELKCPRDIKTKLRQQIYARLALVRQRKLKGIDKPEEQYFGLISIQNELPFIAQMPPANAFAFGEGEVNLRDTDFVERLEDLVNKADFEEKIRGIAEELQIVAEYALKKGDWITARDVKRDRNRGVIATATPEEVRQYFVRLAGMGIGETEGKAQSLKFRCAV